MGKKYCDEAELLPLLLAHGLIRRVRTIAVEVRPLSGESFDIKLNAKAPTVGEAKEQIEREEGTKPRSQLLCRVQVSSDGSNVREFDQEPEELKEDGMALEEGDVIAMGVMPDPVQWRTWPADTVTVSEEGKLATQTVNYQYSLTHTGEELTEGRHYWEVEIAGQVSGTYVGIYMQARCQPHRQQTMPCERTPPPGSCTLVVAASAATASRATTQRAASTRATAWASSSTSTTARSASS